MDDRDAFAMAAMAAMIGNPGKDTYGKAAVKAFPVFAYEWADAMLAVRGDCDEIARLRAEVEALRADAERLTGERDVALGMLADWCVAVDQNGTGWDDWDEHYKDAMYRPCHIRELLDAAIDAARAAQGERG